MAALGKTLKHISQVHQDVWLQLEQLQSNASATSELAGINITTKHYFQNLSKCTKQIANTKFLMPHKM